MRITIDRCPHGRFELAQARPAAAPLPSSAVAWAWQQLVASGGRVRIQDLARGRLEPQQQARGPAADRPGGGSIADPASLAALVIKVGRQALMIRYVDVFSIGAR